MQQEKVKMMTSGLKPVKTALISVYNKDNILPLAKALAGKGVIIYSTGGTMDYLIANNIPVVAVEELTGYPSIFGGRVKTLHPAIFGGILQRRDSHNDRLEAEKYNIPEFDMVIVDLYPFEETVVNASDEQEIIEKIDIGGISLIRAAAKNYKDVLCVAHRDYFDECLNLFEKQDGAFTLEQRKKFATLAFHISSHYDTRIFEFFNSFVNLSVLHISEPEGKVLRYGENPHQKGVFYGKLNDIFEQLHGKELSYNNLLDIDAACMLMEDFPENIPWVGIIKHNNACGVAQANTLKEAWEKALAGDPVSAFGGIIACNSVIDSETATLMNDLFFEILIARGFDENAFNILKSKKNRILLVKKNKLPNRPIIRSAINGILWQNKDTKLINREECKVVTKISPTETEWEDLLFANRIVKHTKSNAIVLVKNKQLIGIGTGQTSRVDALEQAIDKAKKFGFTLEGCVMASDAFFPFPDCVQIAGREKISSIIQPGGSIRDNESIEAADRLGISMIFTGIRHFKH